MSVVPESNEFTPKAELTPPAEAAEPAPVPVEADNVAAASPRVLLYAIIAALASGFLAWGVGEKMYNYYRLSAQALQSSRQFAALNREKGIADRKNAAIAFGTFGALLGLLSGAAGGALRRSLAGGGGAALAGLVLGGAGGSLMGYELTPIFGQFYSDESPSLLLPFLIRGSMWAVAGMAAGLALAVGWRGFPGIPRALIGGLVGSICGTVAFEVVNALLFPEDRNDAVIPSSMQARLLAYLVVSVSVAIGVSLGLGHRARPAGRTPQASL